VTRLAAPAARRPQRGASRRRRRRRSPLAARRPRAPPLQTSSTISAGQYAAAGEARTFDLAAFKAGLRVDVARYEGDEMEFEVGGLSCAMANALRRIIIAEVPTMAIEHVFVVNNTSIIQDEVLAHRLGLVPLNLDARLFEYRARGAPATPRNTAVLRLRVECRRGAGGAAEGEKVLSSALEWLPDGSELPEETGAAFAPGAQAAFLPACGPVHDDILLAKMRPGQAIELEAHATKGVGEEHSKWSPVATAWYRLAPELALLAPPPPDVAAALAAELPGLVRVVGAGPDARAEVDDARRHEKLLEKARRLSGEARFAPYIQLRKAKDRFIFTVESTGAWRPHELFTHAAAVMISKCDKVLEGLARTEGGGGGAAMDEGGGSARAGAV
jgi:DNA-directed RNA polymerase I and III subunit RPAC1